MDLVTLGGLARLRFPAFRNIQVRAQPAKAGVFENSFLSPSGRAGLTASGTNLAGAAPIQVNIAVFSTVASGSGAVLPPTSGSSAPLTNLITVVNAGANALLVYPTSGDAIDSLSASAALSIPPGAAVTFVSAASGQWYSDVGTTEDGTAGTFIANGVTPVTVANAKLTANSVVIFSLKTIGGTVGAYPTLATVTAGTGFTVKATALDTSTYNYAIIN